MINNNIKFSIIIPTYNRSRLLKNTIESVLNQDYSNFELLIVDDGSTDNTEQIVCSIADKRIKYYKKTNGERGAARNYGLSKSSGDYIVYFDSDDIMYLNCLLLANNYIINHSSIEIFHMAYEIKSSDGKIMNYKTKQINDINYELITGNPLSCINVFIRKDIAHNNPFNEDRDLSGLEDWELWLRIAVKYKIYFVSEIASCMINHDDRSVLQISRDKLIQRVEKFMHIILTNKSIAQYYQNRMYLFKSSCFSYVSLHLALTKQYKKDSLLYLFKGIRADPMFLFERRFFAIIKHLLF